MLTYILAVLIILGMLSGWIFVQHVARVFAARHPEFGPVKEDGEGCGGLLCLCKDESSCPKKLLLSKLNHSEEPDKDLRSQNSNFKKL
jgi:hypothetical protein